MGKRRGMSAAVAQQVSSPAGGSGTGWTPSTYGGVSAWFDANDTASLTVVGTGLTNWADSSGNGVDLAARSTKEPTYDSRTINGIVVPEFHPFTPEMWGAGPWQIVNATDGSVTFMAVAEIDDVSDSNNLISLDDENAARGPLMRINNQTKSFVFRSGESTIVHDNGTTESDGVLAVFTTVITASTVETWANNVSTGSTAISPVVSFTGTSVVGLGCQADPTPSGNLDGLLAEVVTWDEALTDENRQLAELDLATKWGLDTSPWEFDPANYGTVSLWLDAADATTLTLDGSDVTTWADKSANGFDMVSTVDPTDKPTYSASRQINSINVLDFDGTQWLATATNDDVQNATTGEFSVAVVFIVDVTDATNYFILDQDPETGTRGPQFFRAFEGNAESIVFNTTARVEGEPVSVATEYVGFVTASQTDLQVWLNNTSNGATSYASGNINHPGTDKLYLGSSAKSGDIGARGLNGAIAEVVVWDEVLDATNRANAQTALADKWGITLA